MTKILLISPPAIKLWNGLRKVTHKFPPLGLAYLASFLEKNSIKVEIYDAFVEDASFEEIEERIIRTEAEFIGITTVTTLFSEVFKIAKLAKKYKRIVILGGPHVTALGQEILKSYDCFDYIVTGEGEITLLELLKDKPLEEIDGLFYKKNGNLKINKKRGLVEDIDIFPHPARHLLKNNLYKPADIAFSRNKKFFTIITSRGCPFNCIFCASKLIWGNKVRYRSLEDIFSELDELKLMGMEQLMIVDDTFTLDKNRVIKIAQKIKSLNIEWGCNARVNCIDEEIVEKLKESNCVLIKFGVESGNQKILDIMKKQITLDQVKTAIRLIRKFGIKVSCSFIIGNLGDTKYTIEQTISFAKKLNCDFVEFAMLTPYPGTEVYQIVKKNNYLIKDFFQYQNPKFVEPVLDLPNLSASSIKRLLIKAYFGFYTNPKYLAKIFFNITSSFNEFCRLLRLIARLVEFIICQKYFNFSNKNEYR